MTPAKSKNKQEIRRKSKNQQWWIVSSPRASIFYYIRQGGYVAATFVYKLVLMTFSNHFNVPRKILHFGDVPDSVGIMIFDLLKIISVDQSQAITL